MIERPGSMATTGSGMPQARAFGGDGLGDAGGELADRRRVVGGRVRDAEAAAEVELGHRAAGEQLRVQRRAGARADSAKPAASKICEPMWQWRPRKSSAGVRADGGDELRCVGERDAELLVLVGGRQELVSVRVHAAVDPQPHAPACGRGRAAAAATRSISISAVDDDGADAEPDGALDLGERLVVAVEAELARVGAAASATASSPPLQTSMLRPASCIQRATSMLRNALPA